MSLSHNPQAILSRGVMRAQPSDYRPSCRPSSWDPAVHWLRSFESPDDIAHTFDDMSKHYAGDDSPLAQTHRLTGSLELAAMFALEACDPTGSDTASDDAAKYLEQYREILASLPPDFVDARGYRQHSTGALLETHDTGLGWDISTMQLRCTAIAHIASATIVEQLVDAGTNKPKKLNRPEKLSRAEAVIVDQLDKLLAVQGRLSGEARIGAIGGATELALYAAQLRDLRKRDKAYWLIPASTRLDWADFQRGGEKVDAIGVFPLENRATPIQYKGDQPDTNHEKSRRVCVISKRDHGVAALALINAVAHSGEAIVNDVGKSVVGRVISFRPNNYL